jgi:hypothetical protein
MYGRIGRQKMLAEIYKECGSIFGKGNTTMTDKQIIIDENKINPNDWLEPYKPIPACEIKDCEHWVYAGNNVYGCRIAEDGLVCDDFNNDDECCMYRQLEYYKETLKAKEQECEVLKSDNLQEVGQLKFAIGTLTAENLHLKELLDMRIEALCDSCKAGSMLPIKCRIYEKTLTEIKEIAERGFKHSQCNCGAKADLDLILQKISECEGSDGLQVR